MFSIIIYLAFFNICAVLKWGLGGFAPDKRGVGDAPPLAVGTQTLCLPRFSGSSTAVLIAYQIADSEEFLRGSSAYICAYNASTFVVGNVSRRLSEELPLVYFFLYIGVPPFSKNTDRGIMKKA